MLNTIKTIITVNGTRGRAALSSAICYGFYALIIQQIAGTSLAVAIIVTFITNLIGVYISVLILDKLKKQHIWKYTITTADERVKTALNTNEIGYTLNEVIYKDKKLYSIEAFSNSRADSQLIKGILDTYRCKYCVTDTMNTIQ